MITNKSLSARIRRRNKNGFFGIGTGHIVDSKGNIDTYTSLKAASLKMGDYTDENQNGKLKDRMIDNIRKSKLGINKPNYKFDNNGNIIYATKGSKNRQMCKKYADNHQKV